MYCTHCDRELSRCICEDADARIEDLRNCKALDPGMIDRIQAERLLAKFEIEEDRKNARKPAGEAESPT